MTADLTLRFFIYIYTYFCIAFLFVFRSKQSRCCRIIFFLRAIE